MADFIAPVVDISYGGSNEIELQLDVLLAAKFHGDVIATLASAKMVGISKWQER